VGAKESNRVIQYVLDNPVKAGLAQTREEWLWGCVRWPWQDGLSACPASC